MRQIFAGKLKNRFVSVNSGPISGSGRKKTKTFNVRWFFFVLASFLIGLSLLGGPVEVGTQEPDTDGDLRLINTADGTVVNLGTAAEPSGRLEIFDDADGDGTGEWKGICDDNLGVLGSEGGVNGNFRVVGRQEAKVACRQLGFSGGFPLTQLPTPLSVGADPSAYYLLDDLECSGTESRILGEDKCKHLPRGENDCDADEAFGVVCEAPKSNNDAVGHIQINPLPGNDPETRTGVTVIANHTGVTDSDGKPTEENSFMYQWIRVDFVYDEIEISGATDPTYTFQADDEESWIKVRIRFIDDAGNLEELESFEIGSVFPDLPDGSLRLKPTVNLESGQTSGPTSGLLEIFDREARLWKGICDDGWALKEAEVACKQLGLSGGAVQTDIVWIGWPPLLFLLDDVVCDGTEDTLLDCGHAGLGVHNCASWEYAGVSCETASDSQDIP